ncbi:MAG TPA: transcriptional repressor LexA [Syntrophomonadaceae bacterium]|nr:transcriptional repressor LexA [Syntrophomonadaceae bacterium]HOQ09432.1 transcriptional repressor LexA [Syntrophomonadaceae bacterium]
MQLTERQQQILDYIRQRIKTSGYPPSVREIGEAVGLRSSSTVHSYLVQLEEMGLIRKDPTKPRAIIPVDLGEPEPLSQALSLPLVGSVAAGTPILAEQNIETYLSVPSEMVGYGTHFLLQVKGDSMIEAGILDGDYLIVRQQSQANNGDIVVAMVEDEATVKRIYFHSDHIELRPENSSMEPFRVTDVQIVGKVTGLMRKM